jgi:hypothetical protein
MTDHHATPGDDIVATARTKDLNGGPRNLKVVLVVRDGLAINQAVNAATVLGASVGSTLSLPLGPDGFDASGTRFAGIITTPVPILVATAEELTVLHRLAQAREGVAVLCLTEAARRARTYDAYLGDLAATPDADAEILALIAAGTRNQVTKLTKRLPLLGAAHG